MNTCKELARLILAGQALERISRMKQPSQFTRAAWRIGFLTAGLLCSGVAVGSDEETRDDSGARFNIQAPTLGGLQFWTDELVFRDWRIQHNSVTGHFRLLDDRNQRRAWGDFEHCRSRLDDLKQQLQLEPLSGPVVLVLHGVTRSRNSMSGMCEYLSEHGPWTVMNVSYASTRGELDAHAAALGRVIDRLGDGVTEVHFVAHSLGNLVIRRYLYARYNESHVRPGPPLGRIVMLTPPNNGAQLATVFRGTPMLEWFWGKSAIQLAEQWSEVDQRLATPRCEFGIIAGGQGTEAGRSPLIEGDDDFIVGVEETKLPGARDFVVLPIFHSRAMSYSDVREYTLRFLQHGHFVSEQERQPIPVAERSAP